LYPLDPSLFSNDISDITMFLNVTSDSSPVAQRELESSGNANELAIFSAKICIPLPADLYEGEWKVNEPLATVASITDNKIADTTLFSTFRITHPYALAESNLNNTRR